MIQSRTPARSAIATLIRGLVVFDAGALLFAAALHVGGARIPLGAAVFVDPQIAPAAMVEGLAGMVFVISAYAVFADRRWAWPVTVGAHLFAIVGFLVGIAAISAGLGPNVPFDYVFHRVMLAFFVAGLVLLLTPAGRAALWRGNRPTS
jgi:hypothetical protein